MVVTEKSMEAEQTLRRGEDVNMMTNSYLGPEVIFFLYLGNDFCISFIFNLNSENLHVYIRNEQGNECEFNKDLCLPDDPKRFLEWHSYLCQERQKLPTTLKDLSFQSQSCNSIKIIRSI